jgi:tRNA 5-methylaminomethyl-2-thiouridine biosynthesis bifunctional protein
MLLECGRLTFRSDGTPFSESYDDVYHSADGGPGQARHVFIEGNELAVRWRRRDLFVIAETGFGLGLNFLATWDAWRADPDRPARLHFLSVEKHPLGAADLARAHARWQELDGLSLQLRAAWPVLVPGFHRLHFESGRLCLTLIFGDAQHALSRLVARADAFYLDGFAPERNADMWSPALMNRLPRLAMPEATFATYSSAGSVREALSAAGFEVEKRPGYGRKREMLRGRLRGTSRSMTRDGASPVPAARAIVIGAGISGSAACERLAARGWQVDVIERHAAPAQEASGNLAGVLRPMLSQDDNLASRLSRACYLYALQHIRTLRVEGAPLLGELRGVLQLARDAQHEASQHAMLDRHGYPPEYVSWFTREQIATRLGRPVESGGWFFPGGGWVNPPGLCWALLSRYSQRVRPLFGREATRLERIREGWCVREARGAIISEAPVIVMATAFDALPLIPASALPLKRVRGQVTYLPRGVNPSPELVLCRQGYLAPTADGRACVGASFDFDDDDPHPRASGHCGNLARLESLLPGAGSGLEPDSLEGRVGFRAATPDRLPLIGALPDAASQSISRNAHLRDIPRLPGLFGLLGYGARGLVLASLAAETLASRINGEPMPLESDVLAAVDPARFLLRAARRGVQVPGTGPMR